MIKRAYIGLGSNLQQPLTQVERAVAALSAHADITQRSLSPWYGSHAVGPGEQPDYVNGVMEIETQLSAPALMQVLQDIEAQQGRERHLRWQARTLDLDLLWYNNEQIDSPSLTVPHPRMCERNFVLFPLRDIAPELEIGGKRTIEIAQGVSDTGIWKL